MNHSRFNIFLNPKNISIKDRGFNYGDGLFETILVKDSKILYLKEHVKRLHDGCNILHLKKPSFLIIKDNIKKVIGRNKNCIIKIILTRGDNSFGYKIPIDIKHNLYFIRYISIVTPEALVFSLIVSADNVPSILISPPSPVNKIV